MKRPTTPPPVWLASRAPRRALPPRGARLALVVSALVAGTAAHAQRGSTPGIPAPTATALADARRFCAQHPANVAGANSQPYQPPEWLADARPEHAPAPRNTGPIRVGPSTREAMLEQLAPTDPHRPELRWSLAEEYLELARALNAQGNGGAAADARQRAQAHLTALVESHPGFARNDEAYFRLGRLAQAAGDMTRARRSWLALIQRYPNSRYVPHAYWTFGEYFFQQGEWANAEQFFARVAAYPPQDNPLYAVALYYLAWSVRHQGDEPRAQRHFAAVVALTAPGSNVPDALALGEKARQDFCARGP